MLKKFSFSFYISPKLKFSSSVTIFHKYILQLLLLKEGKKSKLYFIFYLIGPFLSGEKECALIKLFSMETFFKSKIM